MRPAEDEKRGQRQTGSAEAQRCRAESNAVFGDELYRIEYELAMEEETPSDCYVLGCRYKYDGLRSAGLPRPR